MGQRLQQGTISTSGVFGSSGDFPTQNLTGLRQEHLSALSLRIHSIFDMWGSRRPTVALGEFVKGAEANHVGFDPC